MEVVKLLGADFYKEIEGDVVTAMALSLKKSGKVVTAKTIKSIRAETKAGNIVTISGYAGGGYPWIIRGKKADTKFPVDYKGTRTNRYGKTVKIFSLKPDIENWKAVTNFGGSDFLLARSIAKNPRKAVDLFTEINRYLLAKTAPKISRRYGLKLLTEITDKIKDDEK